MLSKEYKLAVLQLPKIHAIQECRQKLSETDYVIVRHLEEKYQGIQTTKTEEEIADLISDRNTYRRIIKIKKEK